jgi:hypothetical protein
MATKQSFCLMIDNEHELNRHSRGVSFEALAKKEGGNPGFGFQT